MRWIFASVGLLTVIVVFSLAALDQKNVVWVQDKPQCPHCRSEVLEYATVCVACERAFDWKSHDKSCSACLSSRDARYFLHKYEPNAEAFIAALTAAGIEEEYLPGFVEYVVRLKDGACGFCGGSGNWLAPGHQERTTGKNGTSELYPLLREAMAGKCPVCLGTGSCILCDGDRLVECGRETAGRDLRMLQERWARIDPLRDDQSAATRLQLLTTFLRGGHRGRREVADLPSYDQGPNRHLTRAVDRLEFIKKVLQDLP